MLHPWSWPKQQALDQLHKNLEIEANTRKGRTLFEAHVDTPLCLSVEELAQVCTDLIHAGWQASLVPTSYELGIQRYAIRLRSYIDTFAY